MNKLIVWLLITFHSRIVKAGWTACTLDQWKVLHQRTEYWEAKAMEYKALLENMERVG